MNEFLQYINDFTDIFFFWKTIGFAKFLRFFWFFRHKWCLWYKWKFRK